MQAHPTAYSDLKAQFLLLHHNNQHKLQQIQHNHNTELSSLQEQLKTARHNADYYQPFKAAFEGSETAKQRLQADLQSLDRKYRQCKDRAVEAEADVTKYSASMEKADAKIIELTKANKESEQSVTNMTKKLGPTIAQLAQAKQQLKALQFRPLEAEKGSPGSQPHPHHANKLAGCPSCHAAFVSDDVLVITEDCKKLAHKCAYSI